MSKINFPMDILKYNIERVESPYEQMFALEQQHILDELKEEMANIGSVLAQKAFVSTASQRLLAHFHKHERNLLSQPLTYLITPKETSV